MEAMNCQSCQAALLPTKTAQDQLVRCGGCGSTFLPIMNDQVAIQKTDRMAKWSFWLGISSLLLCMITGIPALVLGLRSLRRMRFRAVHKREKFQAMTGTILGLVFGVMGGGCLTVTGVTIGVFASSFEATKEPDRIAAIAQSAFEFDNYLELEPISGITFLIFKTVTYGSEKPSKDSDPAVLLTLLEFHFQPDARNLSNILKRPFPGDKSDYEMSFSDKTDWKAMDTEVTRDLFEKIDDPDQQMVRYLLVKKRDMSWFGACLVYDKSRSELQDDDAKRILRSMEAKIFDGLPEPEMAQD